MLDLDPHTYGPIREVTPYRELEIRVEELSAFGKAPMEVTIRASCFQAATFLCGWRIVADDLGFPRYEARPVAIVCPPGLLKEVYERGRVDGRKESIN